MTLVKFNNNLGKHHNSPFFENKWADDFFRPFFADRQADIANGVAVNIAETPEEFIIEVAAPGLAKEDFKIFLEKDLLKIKVEKEATEAENKPTYHRKEFSYQRFERAFKLPKSVNQEGIAAKYENGLLLLTLPKQVEAQDKGAKEISIS